MDKDKNGHLKQFRTCNNCRNRRRKKPSISNSICDNEKSLEIIEIEALCQNLRELLIIAIWKIQIVDNAITLDVNNSDDSAK